MHGEIKLKGWLPFTAEQVIRRDRGMIWQAAVRMSGLPVRGLDRFLDGEGAMRWKLFGLIPVMTASGPDVTRSAAGRLAAESIWLPSVLLGEDVSWTAPDSSHAQAGFAVQGNPAELALTVGDGGRLESLAMQRWGDPGGVGSTSRTSAGSWRTRPRSRATPFPPACGSGGTSGRSGSSPRASSSG